MPHRTSSPVRFCWCRTACSSAPRMPWTSYPDPSSPESPAAAAPASFTSCLLLFRVVTNCYRSRSALNSHFLLLPLIISGVSSNELESCAWYSRPWHLCAIRYPFCLCVRSTLSLVLRLFPYRKEREREREREREWRPQRAGGGAGPIGTWVPITRICLQFQPTWCKQATLGCVPPCGLLAKSLGTFSFAMAARIHPIGDTKFGIWANRFLWLPTGTDKKPANLTYPSRSKRRISHPFVRWSILLSGLGGSLSPSCCPFYPSLGYCTLLCLLIRGLGLWPTSAPCRMDDMWTGNTFSFCSCPISNHCV